MYAPRGLKIATRLLQVSLLEPIWAQLGPKLAPSWLKLGPCWAQVGSNLAQVGPMLAPFASPQPPLGQQKHFQTLPFCLLASQTPVRPKMDSKRASQASNLDPKHPTWNPNYIEMDIKKLPPRPTNPRGVASLTNLEKL